MHLIFFLAMRQLWARKLLNGIAVCGVSLGVLVLIGMNGIMQGFQMKFKGEILRVSPHVTIYDKQLGQEQNVTEQAWQQSFSGQLPSKQPLLGQPPLSLGRGYMSEGQSPTSSKPYPPAVPSPLAIQVLHPQPNDRVSQIKQPSTWIRIVEEMPEVEAACPGLVGQIILFRGSQERGVDLRGILPNLQDRCTPISTYVQAGGWNGLSTYTDGVALGVTVAEKLGAQVGDTLRIKDQDLSLKVVAIFDSGIPSIDQTRVYVTLTTAQRILKRANVVGRLEIRLKDPQESVKMAARLERMMGYDAESWQEASANFLSLFAMQNMIVSMVIGAILVVGGFGILAIQIMIVLQKTKDIAILRSVGLHRKDILLMFLIQGLVIALIGAALGDLLGWRLVEFLGSLRIKQEGLVKSNTFLVYKDPMFYLYGVLFSLLTGMLASLIPAFRGSKVEPVDVLRGQT